MSETYEVRNPRTRYVVIGTAYECAETVATGTFHTYNAALKASERLGRKGWVTEIVPLSTLGEIGRVNN